MCGIVGLRRFDGKTLLIRELALMTRQLVHRGPDDEGSLVVEDVGLACRRLAIIDPAGSRQPMSRGPFSLVFNGEIFNFRELRAELRQTGSSFHTGGDTEVLLALFERYGKDCIERIDGQFAFAVVDQRSGDLWLFRDRLGILPLYYYWNERIFLFASEIKALLPLLPRPPEVDRTSVKEYLAYRSVPAPHTLFQGVRKLEPGHWLRLDRSGHLEVEPYWRLPNRIADPALGRAEATERLEATIKRAVRSRLVADARVGAYLSGGVDSSLIVALMSQRDGEGDSNGRSGKDREARIETFSAGFEDPRFDELPYAREMSRCLGTRHHEVLVTPSDFRNLMPRLTWHRDAPLSEPADVAVFRMAEEARGLVKVLLSGEGSDEIFAGYPKYRFARWAASAGVVPAAWRPTVFRILERQLPRRASRLRVALRAMSARSEAERFQTWFAPFTAYERARLMGGEERRGYQELAARAVGDRVQRMLYLDCHHWLSDNLLERGDRMSMAASIELRPPFLDHRLVELAFRLPTHLKIHRGHSKWILKEVARRHLPASVVDRQKIGFRVPLDVWFRSELRDMVEDLLGSTDSFVRDVLESRATSELLRDHFSGRRDEAIRLWTLVSLELWHRVFFR